MIVLLEKLKEGGAFAIIETPAFFDNETRNAQTEFIDIRNVRPFRNSSGRTIQSFIGRGDRVGNTTKLKIARQLLVQTKVP